MEYQEFLCVVEKKMNQKLKGGIRASKHIAVKNNGKIKKGIMIENPAINISPTIYLEEFYDRFKQGESMDEIICDLLGFYEAVKYEESWDTSKVERFEAVQDKIVFKLIHTEENQELLKEIPHIEVLDLSIVFYVLLEVKGDSTATMLIRNKHLEMWELEEGDLFPLACENAQRLLPARLYMMKEIVEEILNPDFEEPQNVLEHPECFFKGGKDAGEKDDKELKATEEGRKRNSKESFEKSSVTQGETDEVTGTKDSEVEDVQLSEGEEDCPDVMFVLTNYIRGLGAACLFYPGMPDAIGKILGESYYILPSSIHELILVPKSKGLPKQEMEELVREVNKTQVKEEDQLSEYVYFYDVTRRKLLRL